MARDTTADQGNHTGEPPTTRADWIADNMRRMREQTGITNEQTLRYYASEAWRGQYGNATTTSRAN